MIRAAHWRAARAVPAPELVQALLEFVRPALEAIGDWAEVSALAAQTLRRGNGAMRQREVFVRQGRLADVVDFLVRETAAGVGACQNAACQNAASE